MKDSSKIGVILFCLSFLILSNGFAQPIIEWSKNYGGSNSDRGYSFIQTSDGGYIIGGDSSSDDVDVTENFGESDWWIVKLNSTGVIEWERSYGGLNNESCKSIVQTSDGGYITVGYGIGGNGSSDFLVRKLAANGDVQWENSYGGSGSDSPSSIIQTKDHGYLINGSSGSNDGDVGGNNGLSDIWVIKIDSLGAIEWSKNFGGERTDYSFKAFQTYDDGYLVYGWLTVLTGASIDEDYWVIKLDENGDLEWERAYGGSYAEEARSMALTSDNGFIITGLSYSHDGDVTVDLNGYCDAWIVKLDSVGNIEWNRGYGGLEYDVASFIKQAEDGGYVIAGYTESNEFDLSEENGGGHEWWVWKVSSTGDLEWSKTYGGSGSDRATDIQVTSDGGFAVLGYSSSSDGDFESNYGGTDIWIQKFGSVSSNSDLDFENIDVAIIPNPSLGVFKVEFEDISEITAMRIFNIAGVEIYSNYNIQQELEFADFPKGQYVVQIILKRGVLTKKFIVH